MSSPSSQARKRQLARLNGAKPPTARAAMAFAKSQAYQDAADAPATLRAYTADLANYKSWCERHGFGSVSDHAVRLVVSRDRGYDPPFEAGRARCVARNADRQRSENGLSELCRGIVGSAVWTAVKQVAGFHHPLLRLKAHFDEPMAALLEKLKDATYKLVTQRAEIQQLEFRGQKIVEDLYDAIVMDPQRLIPRSAWESLEEHDSIQRRVCDYIAGMTDPYAERIYNRLFIPGVGSSRDEL